MYHPRDPIEGTFGEPVCPEFYRAIVLECEKHDWPEGYQSDVFLHDRNYPGDECLWVLRNLGTNIMPIRFTSEAVIRAYAGHGSRDYRPFDWYAHCHASGHLIHYHWTGKRLVRSTPEQAVDLAREGAAWSRRQPWFKKDREFDLWTSGWEAVCPSRVGI